MFNDSSVVWWVVGLVTVSWLGLLFCIFGTFTFVERWGLLIGHGSWHFTPRANCHTRLLSIEVVWLAFSSRTEKSCPSLKVISRPSNLVFCRFSLEVKKKRFHLSTKGEKQKSKKERKKKKEVHPLLLFPSNPSTSSMFNTLICAVTCVLLLIPNLKDTRWPKTHTPPETRALYHVTSTRSYPWHIHVIREFIRMS
jgi:hypothetical protein